MTKAAMLQLDYASRGLGALMIKQIVVGLVGTVLGGVILFGIQRWAESGPELRATVDVMPYRSPVSDIVDVNALTGTLKTVAEIWGKSAKLSGVIRITISNDGDRPATKVSLSVPGQQLVAIDQDTATPITTKKIELGDYPQGYTQTLWVWTGADLSSPPWAWLTQILLNSNEGRGTVTGSQLDAALGWFERWKLVHPTIYTVLDWGGSGVLVLFILTALIIGLLRDRPRKAVDTVERDPTSGHPG